MLVTPAAAFDEPHALSPATAASWLPPRLQLTDWALFHSPCLDWTNRRFLLEYSGRANDGYH
jgi:hypothetical protein